MPLDSSRSLYLVRHAEPNEDGSGLSVRGTRQAEHLGRRLAHLPVRDIKHGPLPRARETARVVAEQLEDAPSLTELEPAGDYVPCVPARDEVPEAWAEVVFSSFADVSEEEAAQGASLGSRVGPTQCHAGLTVIRYSSDGPPTIVVSNDVAHLPADLRWTGFPDESYATAMTPG